MSRPSGVPALPRALLIAVAVIGSTALLFGEWLEFRHGGWLQLHPITTNMISGVIAFATVTFVVGVGFPLLSERGVRFAYERKLTTGLNREVALLRDASGWRNPGIADIEAMLDDAVIEPADERPREPVASDPSSVVDWLTSDAATPELPQRLYDSANRLFTMAIEPYIVRYLLHDRQFERAVRGRGFATTVDFLTELPRSVRPYVESPAPPPNDLVGFQGLAAFYDLLGLVVPRIRLAGFEDSALPGLIRPLRYLRPSDRLAMQQYAQRNGRSGSNKMRQRAAARARLELERHHQREAERQKRITVRLARLCHTLLRASRR